jgi:hypothetical protein
MCIYQVFHLSLVVILNVTRAKPWVECVDTINYLSKHWYQSHGRVNFDLLARFCEPKVRPSERRLVWQTDSGCRLRAYSFDWLRNTLRNRHLHFVGDSMARQHYIDLRCQVESFEIEHDLDNVLSTRNGRLWLDANTSISDAMFSAYLVKISHHRVALAADNETGWTQLLAARNNVVVLNTGAHFSAHSGETTPISKLACGECSLPPPAPAPWPELPRMRLAMRAAFNRTLRVLFDALERAPATVVLRSIAPAHADCAAPARWRNIAAARFVLKPHYFWDEFRARNAVLRAYVRDTNRKRRAARLPPIALLDVYPLLEPRADEHILQHDKPPDCLHYCYGDHSVLNYFNRLLFNALHEYRAHHW